MKRVLYVDMDNVLVDFASAFAHLSEAALREYAGKEDELPGLFALMDPLPHAVESFRELAGIFDTYVLSTAPWENPSAWSDKLEWVKKHLEPAAHKRLILTHNKHLNVGDFLVDDRPNNGADRFSGELIQFGSPQFPDWPTVVDYLRERAT